MYRSWHLSKSKWITSDLYLFELFNVCSDFNSLKMWKGEGNQLYWQQIKYSQWTEFSLSQFNSPKTIDWYTKIAYLDMYSLTVNLLQRVNGINRQFDYFL